MIRKLWVALLTILLLVGPTSPASAGAHLHGSSQGCPYQATASADGCAAAVAAGGLWLNPNFFASIRQSGQTYSAIPGLGGSTATHPPNWNVAGVDYGIGATSRVSSLCDPAVAGCLPAGCTFITASTTAPFANAWQIYNPLEFPTSPFLGYPAWVICNSISHAINVSGVNFAQTALHNCVFFGINDASVNPITLSNAYFFLDADCSNNLTGPVGGVLPAVIQVVPNNNTLASVTIQNVTMIGNAFGKICCQYPSASGIIIPPSSGSPLYFIYVRPKGTVAANNTVTIRNNWFSGIGGQVYNNSGFLQSETATYTQVGSTLTLTLAATLGLSPGQQVELSGFTPSGVNGFYVTQAGTSGTTVVVTQATAVTGAGTALGPTSNVIITNNYMEDFDLRIPQGHGEVGAVANVNNDVFNYNVVAGHNYGAASWDAILNLDNIPNTILQSTTVDHNVLAANLVGGATSRNTVNATGHTLASCAAFPQGSGSCANGSVPGSGHTGVFIIDSINSDSTPGDQQGLIFPGMLPNGSQIALVGLTSFSPVAHGNGVGSMWSFDCGVGWINITKWCTDLSGTNAFYFDNSTTTAEWSSFVQPYLAQYQIDFGHAKAGSVAITNNMYDATGTNNRGAVTAGADTVCGVPTTFSGNYNMTDGSANNAFAAIPIYGGC